MKIDEKIGLPELPSGYFWRVMPTEYNDFVVEIRRKRLFGSRCEDMRGVNYSDTKSINEQIIDAAEYVYERWKITKEREQFFGDYPPKKLL